MRLTPSKVRASTLPTAYFYKVLWGRSHSHSFLYVLPIAAPALSGQRGIALTESVWSPNSKLFPASPFTEEASTGKMGTKEQPGVIQCRGQILGD